MAIGEKRLLFSREREGRCVSAGKGGERLTEKEMFFANVPAFAGPAWSRTFKTWEKRHARRLGVVFDPSPRGLDAGGPEGLPYKA